MKCSTKTPRGTLPKGVLRKSQLKCKSLTIGETAKELILSAPLYRGLIAKISLPGNRRLGDEVIQLQLPAHDALPGNRRNHDFDDGR